jgi:hypothetical protein
MTLVMDAVSLLSPMARHGFLESVAAVLADYDRPPDVDVARALRFILGERGVVVGWRTLRAGHPIDQAMKWGAPPLTG